MQTNSSNTSTNRSSIFELVQRTKRFIRFELVHAGVAVAIFFGIFLVLQPWNYSVGSSEDRPYWMTGLPLIYFTVDLLLALMLHFSMLNELRPRACRTWMILQVVNLAQLTLMGFWMLFWEIEFSVFSCLKLILALVVLYVFKSYRISILQKLVMDMNARCAMTSIEIGGGTAISSNTISSRVSHSPRAVKEEHGVRPGFTVPVQQPQGATASSLPVGNVNPESSCSNESTA